MCHGFNRTLRIWRTDHRGVRHSIELNLFSRIAEDIQVYGDMGYDVPDIHSGDHDCDVLDDNPRLTDRDDADIHDDPADIIDRD